jgi:transcription elongation factor Elf1
MTYTCPHCNHERETLAHVFTCPQSEHSSEHERAPSSGGTVGEIEQEVFDSFIDEQDECD